MNTMAADETLRRNAGKPMEDWSQEDIRLLIDVCRREVKEWERVLGEAVQYLMEDAIKSAHTSLDMTPCPQHGHYCPACWPYGCPHCKK
jgi:hypothetical protein